MFGLFKKAKVLTPKNLKLLEWLKAHDLLEHFHQFMERPDAFTRLTSGMLGWTWEQDFERLCRERSLQFEEPPSLNRQYDCTVEGLRVQCKHTSKFPRVDVRNKNKNTKRRYRTTDFDVMALRSCCDVYIIPISFFPTGELGSSDVNLIPVSINLNDYGYFKNNWHTFGLFT